MSARASPTGRRGAERSRAWAALGWLSLGSLSLGSLSLGSLSLGWLSLGWLSLGWLSLGWLSLGWSVTIRWQNAAATSRRSVSSAHAACRCGSR